MTRKFICTASLFVVALGIIYASYVIRVPLGIWWDNGIPVKSLPFIAWVFISIAVPAAFLLVFSLVLVGLWQGCASICARLRGQQ